MIHAQVLEFLDLPCLASALRVSLKFSEAAEPVFRGIARRHGRTDKLESSWRDTVRLECNALIWMGATDTLDEMVPEPHQNVGGLGSSRVHNSGLVSGWDGDDVYVVARGLPFDQLTEWTWRVEMSKRPNAIDSCSNL